MQIMRLVGSPRRLAGALPALRAQSGAVSSRPATEASREQEVQTNMKRGRGYEAGVSARRQAPERPGSVHAGQPVPQHAQQQPHIQEQQQPAPASNHVVPQQHQSNMRFADLPVSHLTKRAMSEVFGYEFCTPVQAQSLPACLSGSDVLAKAKTGTGKTIGFMIPTIERLLQNPPRPGQVGALVLSPTRELATQIYQEAVKLLTFHKKEISVQVVIGGTNVKSDIRLMRERTPTVLICTPGRCLDHLTTPESPLKDCVADLRVLVCDEADNLLDMGFRPSLEKIFARLPPKGQRQALLFSATFPRDVQDLANFALKAPWKVVDTVGVETQTNLQVEQYQQVVPFDDVMYYVYAALQQHIRDNPHDYKVIVFLPTARQTQLFAEAFEAAGLHVLEIHSRKSQSHRNRVSDEFRTSPTAILFSSDVSARGVDYPDVSLVMQVGVPSDKAQYVHRVGRTARAGKAGEALLVLADFEESFLDKLHDLPIQQAPQLPYESRQQAMQAVQAGLKRVSEDTKAKAYVAWLGCYNSCGMVKLSSAELVQLANRFSALLGCVEPPEIEAKTIGKMGLKGVPGLRISGGRGGAGGRGGGRGGGGTGGGRPQSSTTARPVSGLPTQLLAGTLAQAQQQKPQPGPSSAGGNRFQPGPPQGPAGDGAGRGRGQGGRGSYRGRGPGRGGQGGRAPAY